MPSLWFVVPAHGRVELARICLRQLRRTCDAMTAEGLEATAVVIADDANLDTARELGFATVRRDNEFLSRKFNDGIQAALDPQHNPRPADFVVPFGTDDWVDHRLFRNLPEPNEILGFQLAAFVNEDGDEIATRHITYEAGVGIRVYPAAMMALCGYRPGDEDRKRACDTSMLGNVKRELRTRGMEPRIMYADLHPYQIVDWKSRGEQLNTFTDITSRFMRGSTADPYEALADFYPAEALDEIRSHYAAQTSAVAA